MIFSASIETARLLGYRENSASISCRSSTVNMVQLPSSVYVGQDEINAAKNGKQVGNHQAPAHQGKHLHMRKRWGTDSSAIRYRIAITHQVIAVVSLSRLNRSESFARRHHGSPTHTQKVCDQGLDVVHRVILDRRGG